MSLKLKRTYAGLLEANPESVTPFLLQDWRRDAAGKARGVLEPKAPYKLPEWECFAAFQSYRAVHTDDSDYGSRFEVVWWIEQTNQTIDRLAGDVLSQLDWDAQAEDYDIMP